MTHPIASFIIPGTELHEPVSACLYDDLSVEIIQGDENVWLSNSQFTSIVQGVIDTLSSPTCKEK